MISLCVSDTGCSNKCVYSDSLQDIFCLPTRYDVGLCINAKSEGMIYISDFGSLLFRASNY